MPKKELKTIIWKAIKAAYPRIELPEFIVEEAEPKFGDYGTNVALILAQRLGKNPAEVGKEIIKIIKDNSAKRGPADSGQLIDQVEFTNPGFINFKMSLPYWDQKIADIMAQEGKYGRSDLGKDIKANVEFISANPTGPLTLGNGRGGYCGDTLARVLEYYGADVQREYYINDAGAQINILGHSVLKDDQGEYKGKYIDEIALKIKAQEPAEAGKEAAAILMEEYIKKTIERMGIKFDHWFSQTTLLTNGRVAEIVSELEKAGFSYQKDGAVWLKTTDFGDDKDRVLITKEGEYTYFSSDITYHLDKIKRQYNLLLDFWGADHHGYVKRVEAALEMLKGSWVGELQILIFQFVRLISKGKEIKMSKRLGTYVTLDELLDEVGPDVARFFFLQRALNTHLDFDLDLAKIKNEKNPVYYVQYAYARIHSILAKFKAQKSNVKTVTAEVSPLCHPDEIALTKKLIKLPELVEEIAGNYQIQKLPAFAIELADAFHRFYEECPVLKAESKTQMEKRLQIIQATQIVLKNTFDLMGIAAPEKM